MVTQRKDDSKKGKGKAAPATMTTPIRRHQYVDDAVPVSSYNDSLSPKGSTLYRHETNIVLDDDDDNSSNPHLFHDFSNDNASENSFIPSSGDNPYGNTQGRSSMYSTTSSSIGVPYFDNQRDSLATNTLRYSIETQSEIAGGITYAEDMDGLDGYADSRPRDSGMMAVMMETVPLTPERQHAAQQAAHIGGINNNSNKPTWLASLRGLARHQPQPSAPPPPPPRTNNLKPSAPADTYNPTRSEKNLYSSSIYDNRLKSDENDDPNIAIGHDQYIETMSTSTPDYRPQQARPHPITSPDDSSIMVSADDDGYGSDVPTFMPGYYHRDPRQHNPSRQSQSPSDSPSVLSERSGTRSHMSHRSSTSLSLLYGEVITLGGTRRSASGNRGPLFASRPEQQRQGPDIEAPLQGMQIGGPSSRRGAPATKAAGSQCPRSPGGSATISPVFPDNEFVQHVKNKTVFISKTTQQQVSSAFGFFGSAGARMFSYYRPPPTSPNKDKVDDLKTLKARHQEKFGPWYVDPESNFERQEYFDFCLILTPQESYRYWSELLDFRVEHLGENALNATPLAGASLERCATESTDASESPNMNYIQKQELQVGKQNATTPSKDAAFETPTTGIHRRRGGTKTPSSPSVMEIETPPPSSAARTSVSTAPRTGRKLSMFEKALGSPEEAETPDNLQANLTSDKKRKVTGPRPSMSSARRRWGNRTVGEAPNKLSPPVRSLTRGNSMGASLRRLQVNATPSKKGDNTANDTAHETPLRQDEPRNPNELRIEDIPMQVIPRGIAVRTNGMLQFLSALKRGIILRRHRPNKSAVYCKLFSTDNGDTVQFQLIDASEAMVGFKEQRVRYNRNIGHDSNPNAVRGIAQPWACLDEPDSEEASVVKFAVPDHIAAQRYREKVKHKGAVRRVADVATRAANSGIFRAADIVAVHPAQHPDPRSRRNELGTSTLRKSKSLHYTPHTFSLITTVGARFTKTGQKDSIDVNENKWYCGDGNDLQFKTIDLEAATEGEYWLIFRGFLLLHRDAAVGRFAAQRRAGIGGGMVRSRDHDPDSQAAENENKLHRNEFQEPATVGWLEKQIVDWRELDTTYMTGSVLGGAKPPPSDYFLGFSSPGTQIWSRLRLAGFETQRIYAVDNRRVMIKVRCPEDRLVDVAEVLRVKLKTMYGGYAPFREDTSDIFKPRYDALDCPAEYLGKAASLLRSKDRQMIIDFIINSRIRDSGAELGATTDVGKMIQARVPLHIRPKLEPLYQGWVFFWRRSHWTGRDGKSLTLEQSTEDGTDETATMLDKKFDDEIIVDLEKTARERKPPNIFKRLFLGAFYQPLDSVEDYFGGQVSFYFAWLQHAASHLLILTVFGLIVSVVQYSNNSFDHPIRPFFAMVVMLWTFVVLVNWRKRSNFLAHRWGTMDHKVQETTRPEFRGSYVQDEVTKEWVVKYSNWKRWIKYVISVPVSILFAATAMLLILLVHANRDLQLSNYIEHLNHSTTTEQFKFRLSFDVFSEEVKVPKEKVEFTPDMLKDGTVWLLMAGLPAMLGLCMPLLNLILMKLSVMLNNFENYRTESEYRAALIIKVFSFRFVSQFGTVYYYAYLSIGNGQEVVENGIVRMGSSLLIYTTVSHWFQILLQVYFFMLIRQIRRVRYNRLLRKALRNIELAEEAMEDLETKEAQEKRQVELINKRILLDQAQDDVWFEVMNPPHNSFPEYITAVVQFTFVACFSVVMPIIPFFCLINCLLSMRFDAYKLCRGRQRPLAKKTGGIGVWEHLLHIVAVIAVLTNCWLMGFTNASFTWLAKKIGNTGLFGVVVAWEHVMLLIKYVLQTAISPLPKSVRDKLRKEQYRAERERNYTLMARKKRTRRPKMDKSGSQMWLPEGSSFEDDSFRVSKRADYEKKGHLQTIPSSDEEASGIYCL